MAVAALGPSECDFVPVRQHHVVKGHLHRSVATHDFGRIDRRDGSVCGCLSPDNEEATTSTVYRMNVLKNFEANLVVKPEVGRREIVQQTQPNGRRFFNDQCWYPFPRRRLYLGAFTWDGKIPVFLTIASEHCIDYRSRDASLTQMSDIFRE